MNSLGFYPANVLLPTETDLTKWSVVACDQYTSQPDYWQEVESFVGDAPSTLRMIVPELYLEQPGVEQRIAAVNAAMDRYLADGIFRTVENFIYVRRTLRDGKIRRGLIGVVDLEKYDFTKGSQSLIRATEGTVLERIPPRVKVRENAALECPHIMLLIDDPMKTVIEPVEDRAGELEQVYQFDLMQDSGSLEGILCDDSEARRILAALDELADPEAFNARYDLTGKAPLLFAVGDGNHSLATAKTCYENLKKVLPPEEARVHPARYALVEVVNLHDASLEFEPIHRVVFGVDEKKLLEGPMRCAGRPACGRMQRKRENRAVFLPSIVQSSGGDASKVLRRLHRRKRRTDRLYPWRGSRRRALRPGGKHRVPVGSHAEKRTLQNGCARRRIAAEDLFNGPCVG